MLAGLRLLALWWALVDSSAVKSLTTPVGLASQDDLVCRVSVSSRRLASPLALLQLRQGVGKLELQSDCLLAYAQCGGEVDGKPWPGATCCIEGFVCVFQNQWYSQCVPSTGSQPTTTPKPSAPPQTTLHSTDCLPAHAQCGGELDGTPWAGPTCCVEGFTCFYQSQWYSQCVPLPAGDLPTSQPTSQPSPQPTMPPSTPQPTSPPTSQPTLPTPQPTPYPTPGPTPQLTPEPTEEVIPEPTPQPTPQPTLQPTPQPAPQPTSEPTPQPTLQPTAEPTLKPTPQPTLLPTPLPTTQPRSNLAGSIVAKYGRLRVNGSKVVDEAGSPVQLQGMSLYWSQWMPQFYTPEVVAWLKSDWHVTVVRAAMAIEPDGYLAYPDRERARVETIVEAAIKEGVYVIIDWHDHYADQHQAEAESFFKDMAMKYGQYPNVLFEVFNEPVHHDWSSVLKPYHEALVSVIRNYTTNLIILGSRRWSTEVAEAAADPVQGTNLVYSIHLYTATRAHKQRLRDKASRALQLGIPLFATEWGTCEAATASGTPDLVEAITWLEFFAEHNISHANWAISDKDETCSALVPGASAVGGWQLSALSTSGSFVRAWIRGNGDQPETTLPQDPDDMGCSEEGEDCRSTKCCSNPVMACFEKNEWWGGCRTECEAGVDPNDPPEFQTPWTCKLVGSTPSVAAMLMEE